MNEATQTLIAALHRAERQYVLALTGGGSGAAAQLLRVPGGSRTILEIIVPYSEQALADFLGRDVTRHCSAESSRAMAFRARDRARWLAPEHRVLGLGCTASLVTDRPKQGDHRVHVSWCAGSRLATHSLVLTKGARDRPAEESVVDLVILNALAEGLSVGAKLSFPLLPGEELCVEHESVPGPEAFFEGTRSTCWIMPDGQSAEKATPAAILPGSFNPVHEGHWGLAATAERLIGSQVAFELSVTNVDKPELNEQEVRRRLAGLLNHGPVVLTRAATFLDKARIFPGVVFVVGADTAWRIVEPRYYGNDPQAVVRALGEIRELGCRFLVAGRPDASGKYIRAEDVPWPAEFRDMIATIPPDTFHVDISSTQLRGQA
jgi:hypothetical protein